MNGSIANGVPWVYGAVMSAQGMTLVIRPEKGPCLACLYPEPAAETAAAAPLPFSLRSGRYRMPAGDRNRQTVAAETRCEPRPGRVGSSGREPTAHSLLPQSRMHVLRHTRLPVAGLKINPIVWVLGFVCGHWSGSVGLGECNRGGEYVGGGGGGGVVGGVSVMWTSVSFRHPRQGGGGWGRWVEDGELGDLTWGGVGWGVGGGRSGSLWGDLDRLEFRSGGIRWVFSWGGVECECRW